MKKRRKGKRSKSRRISLKLGAILLGLLAILGAAGDWFVHHPRTWIAERPAPLAKVLLWFGNPRPRMVHEPVACCAEERKQAEEDRAEFQRETAGLAPFAFTTFFHVWPRGR